MNTETWDNTTNIEFYEKMPVAQLQQYSQFSGLSSGCDIALVYEHIKNANSILIVGAGYGRDIEHLIKLGYTGKIIAVERSRLLYNALVNYFNNYNVIAYCIDIMLFHIDQQFDAIVWMWSGISDFSNTEQPIVVKKIATHLSKKGKLIIDTLIHDKKLENGTETTNQEYTIQLPTVTGYGFKPSFKDIENYAKNAGLSNIKHWAYETPTGKKRNLHLLTF